MITAKEVKIRKNTEFTSYYIENELKKLGFDVLRWAITAYDDEYYTVSIAVVED